MPILTKKKSELMLNSIIHWNAKIFNLINSISEQNFVNRDRLLEVWCNNLSGKDFIYCRTIGVWLFSNDEKSSLRLVYYKDKENQIKTREITRLELSHTIFLEILNSSEYIHVLTMDEIIKSISWLPSCKIFHSMILKIISNNECIGFIEFCNQYKRLSLPEFCISEKGFNWLVDNKIFNYKSLNYLFEIISKKIGSTLARIKQAEILKQYVSDLVQQDPKNKKMLFNTIKDNIVELTGASHFTFWIYDKDNKQIMLNYLYGLPTKNLDGTVLEPKETVLEIDKSWLGTIIDKNLDMAFISKPSSEKYFRQSWINVIGDIPISAFTLKGDNNEIYGISTIHFSNQESIEIDIVDKASWYFKMIAPIINSFRDKIDKSKKATIQHELTTWLNELDIQTFYKKLTSIAKIIFDKSECSVFLKDKRRENIVKLIHSTSVLLQESIGKNIYDLNSENNENFGITGRVMTDKSYHTLFYRIKDYTDYSGGRCDEIVAEGNVSVIYGRLFIGDDVIGVIRCVIKNKFTEIDENSKLYLAFDKDDESIIHYIALLSSMIMKLLLCSEDEKEKIQELEHETITPISIVIHELDDLELSLRDFMKLNSMELQFKVNADSHLNLDKSVWTPNTLNDFHFWLYRLRIAKLEAQITSNLLRAPNVVDIPIEKYNFEKIKLSKLIVPSFYHAAYLANIKGKRLKKFKTALEFIRENNNFVRVDRTMFNQAFLHIIDNAIKYGLKENLGKYIDYDIWFEVYFIEKENKKFFRLCICNFGLPIPDSEREIIFKKHISGEYAKKSKKAGKGLGLYVAKTVIENFEGSISINYDNNEFIEFYLDLPIF